ncbi:hypothetical protein [Leuconostoc suionicum]
MTVISTDRLVIRTLEMMDYGSWFTGFSHRKLYTLNNDLISKS